MIGALSIQQLTVSLEGQHLTSRGKVSCGTDADGTSRECLWETDFYAPPTLRDAALLDDSAPATMVATLIFRSSNLPLHL